MCWPCCYSLLFYVSQLGDSYFPLVQKFFVQVFHIPHSTKVLKSTTHFFFLRLDFSFIKDTGSTEIRGTWCDDTVISHLWRKSRSTSFGDYVMMIFMKVTENTAATKNIILYLKDARGYREIFEDKHNIIDLLFSCIRGSFMVIEALEELFIV